MHLSETPLGSYSSSDPATGLETRLTTTVRTGGTGLMMKL